MLELADFNALMCSCVDDLRQSDTNHGDSYDVLKQIFENNSFSALELIIELSHEDKSDDKLIPLFYRVFFHAQSKDLAKKPPIEKWMEYMITNTHLKQVIQTQDKRLLQILLSDQEANKRLFQGVTSDIHLSTLENDAEDIFKLLFEKGLSKKTLKKSKEHLTKLIIDKNAIRCMKTYSHYELTDLNEWVGNEEEDNALCYAIRTGKTEIAACLIDSGMNLDFQNKQGETALHLAVKCKQPDLVSQLIKAGAATHIKEPISQKTAVQYVYDMQEGGEKNELIVRFNETQAEQHPLIVKLQNESPFFKNLIAKKRKVTPDIKMFAHFNTGYTIKSSELEGESLSNTTAYYADLLKRMPTAMINQEQINRMIGILYEVRDHNVEIKNALKEPLPKKDSERKIIKDRLIEQLLQRLLTQKELWLPGGYSNRHDPGHAMLYHIEIKENTVYFKIYNTGAGADHHQSKNGQYHSIQSFKFPLTRESSPLKNLLSTILYFLIDAFWAAKKIDGNLLYSKLVGFKPNLFYYDPFDPEKDVHKIKGSGFVFYQGSQNIGKRYCVIQDGVVIAKDRSIPADYSPVNYEQTPAEVKAACEQCEVNLSTVRVDDNNKVISPHSNQAIAYALKEINKEHNGCLMCLGAEEISLNSDHTLMTDQKGGNCTAKVVQSGLIKDLLPDQAQYSYTKLMVRLQSTVDFLLASIESGAINQLEVQQEIEEGIKKTALLLNKGRTYTQPGMTQGGLSDKDYLEILHGLETISNGLKEIQQKPRVFPSTKTFPAPATIEFTRSHDQSLGIIVVGTKGKRISPSPKETKLTYDSKLNRFADLYTLLDYLNEQKKHSPPYFFLKQNIAEVLKDLPYDLLRNYNYEQEKKDDFWYLEDKELLNQLYTLKQIILIFNENKSSHFSPKDSMVNEQLLFLLEHTKHLFEKRNQLPAKSKHASNLLDLNHQAKSKRINISPSNSTFIEGIRKLHAQSDTKDNTKPIHLIPSEIKKNKPLIDELALEGLRFIKSEKKGYEGEQFEKIQGIEDIESPESLACAYLVVHSSEFELNENDDKKKRKPKALVLSKNTAHQIAFFKNYYQTLDCLSEGLLGGERSPSLLRLQRQSPIRGTLGLDYVSVKQDRQQENKSLLTINDTELSYYQFDESQKEVNRSLHYNTQAPNFINALSPETLDTDTQPQANQVQIKTALGAAHQSKNKLREITHLQTQAELKFIKTVDYLAKNTDKLTDPNYFRMIRICLLNSQSLSAAKSKMPQSIMAFCQLVSDTVKRHTTKEHIEEKALKILLLFAVLTHYIEPEDSTEIQQACHKVRVELRSFIDRFNPTLKQFKNTVEEKQAYDTLGHLCQSWLITLSNKATLDDSDLENYVKSIMLLSQFPRDPDDPLQSRLLDLTTYKALKAFAKIDEQKIGDLLEKAGVPGAKKTKWQLKAQHLIDSNGRSVDLLTGAVKSSQAQLSTVPANAFKSSTFTTLLPDLPLSHPAERYTFRLDESLILNEFNCAEFVYHDENYRYIEYGRLQKQFQVKSLYGNWWQLQTNVDSFMGHFPRALWDGDHQIWANCDERESLLISTDNGKAPKYLVDKGKVYKLNDNVLTDYVLLKSDSRYSVLHKFIHFEDPNYCLAWQSTTQIPSLVIELPRYNLVFTADNTSSPLQLKCAQYPGYTVNLEVNHRLGPYFTNYLELIPDKDNQSQNSLSIVPNQPFIAPPAGQSKASHHLKYKGLDLDLSSSIKAVQNTKKALGNSFYTSDWSTINMDRSPTTEHYSGCESFTTFELYNDSLLAKSKDDLLQAIYLYIGYNDYKKAYALTTQYITQGGFTGSAKEIRMMNWLVNDIPYNVFHPKDPRAGLTRGLEYTHPTLIAIKLKLIAQVAKYANVGIALHLTSEQQGKLNMPDWEFERINGSAGNEAALGAAELKKQAFKWQALYKKQFKNIPKAMRLNGVEEANLINLTAPTRVQEQFVVNPVKPPMSVKADSIEALSILGNCSAMGITFEFQPVEEGSVKTNPVFVTPDKATQLTKQLIEKANEDCSYAKKMQYQRSLRHQELSKKLKQNNNYLKLIAVVDQKTTMMQTELKEEKAAILKLVNRVLDRDENRLSLLSGQNKRLTMADLNQLLVKRELAAYKEASLLSDDDIEILKQKHIQYLAKKAQFKINKNFLKLCAKAKRSEQFDDFAEIIPELDKWYFKERVYKVQNNPEFLIFEAKHGMLIDEKQYSILSQLSEYSNEQFNGRVTQLIMGGGKSKVLLPLLALLKAKGTNLSIIVVADALLQTNYQDLASVAKSTFNQDIYRFSFARHANYSEEQLLTKLNQLKIIKAQRSFIVMNKTSLEDLELKLIEMMKRKHPEDQKSIAIMKQMLLMFRNEGDALIDEIHLVHDIKVERNFTIADGTVKLKPAYIHSCMALYEFFKEIEGPNDQSLFDYISQKNAGFTEEDLKVLMPKIIAKLCTSNKSPLAQFIKNHHNQFTDMPKELSSFLSAKSHLLFLDELHDEETQALYIFKELLSNLLPLNLRRNPLENYDLSKRSEELIHVEGSIVKPCRNVDKVNEDSRFSSPYETLNYTILYALKFGIQMPVFKAYLTNVKKAALHEHALTLNSTPISATQAAKEFAQLTGLDPGLLQYNLDAKQLNVLHQQCCKRANFIMHCLEHQVLPLIDTDTLLLKHNAINHAFQFRSVQGFSGTIVTPNIFDPRMQAFDEDFAKGTDGETISHLVAKKPAVEKVNSEHIDEVMQQLLSHIRPKTSSIIDIGGLLKGKDRLDYVSAIAEHFKKQAESGTVSKAVQYILFFDENDVLSAYRILDQNPKIISIGSTDFDVIKDKLNIKDPGEYFSLYFQDYTVGIDIKQIPDGEGLVTVGNSTTKAKFLQGVMRMRGLALNQSVKIFLDKQAQNEMAQEVETRNYTYQDVLNYVFKKQTQKIGEDNVTATRYMLRNVLRNQLVLLILLAPEHDASRFNAFQSLLFDESATEPCRLFNGVKKIANTLDDLNLLKGQLLKQFQSLSAEVIHQDLANTMLSDLNQEMDEIINKQLPKCEQQIETPVLSYDSQSISEKAVTVENKTENKMEKQQELENQNTGAQTDYVKLAYIPWPDYSNWSDIKNDALNIDNSIKAPLFSQINTLLPKDSGFSANLYGAVNLLYSVKHQHTTPLDNLKKPVEFVIWTPTDNNQYLAVMITGDEFLEIQKKQPYLGKTWIESVGGIPAMGTPAAELGENYYQLKTDIAIYNCDLEYLILNRSLHPSLLKTPTEKLNFLRDRIVPLHAEREPTWPFFDKFLNYLKKNQLHSFKETQAVRTLFVEDKPAEKQRGESKDFKK